MDEAVLRSALGPYVAPTGLLDRVAALPFLGQVACSHDQLVAGEWTEVRLDYAVGQVGLADGAGFKATFKFYSDWALFQTSDPAAPNFISAEYHAAPLLPGQSAATVQGLKVRFDQKGHERPFQKSVIVDVVDGYLNPGDRIRVRLGDRRQGGPGTRVQTFVEAGFRFRCYVDPLGSSRFAAVPGDIVLDIVPGAPTTLAIRAPRLLRPGTPARVTLRLDDAWGNACTDVAAEVALRALRDGSEVYARTLPLNQAGRQRTDGWAFATIDDLPNEPGALQLAANLPALPRVTPATCLLTFDPDAPAPRLLQGELHGHAEDSVGINDTDYNLRFARDCAGLDFTAYTANDFQITDANWRRSMDQVAAVQDPGRFVAFATQEWCGSSCAGGDHLVVFLQDGPPPFPQRPDGTGDVRSFQWNEELGGGAVRPGAWPIERLWHAYVGAPEHYLIMPHVGGRRAIMDWHHPELERLLEICSSWGHFEWFYRDALARGHQLGCYGGGDEHRGRPGGGAPGAQVFGVSGGTTALLCEDVTRAAIGRALRARHTAAHTGPNLFGFARCGPHVMGDAFAHQGPATIDFRFAGQAGWDEIVAFDHAGLIWRRDCQQEAGYSPGRIRVRWGGARVRDRYRACEWSGQIDVLNATILQSTGVGFEHPEARCWRAGATTIGFRSDTYGDSDAVELLLDGLADARLRVHGRIDGYVKVGDPLGGNPFVHCPTFDWTVGGAELLAAGTLRRALGGTEMFLAIERLSDHPMPTDVAGTFAVSASNGPHGHRPVFLRARGVDDHKVWTSAMFINFADGETN